MWVKKRSKEAAIRGAGAVSAAAETPLHGSPSWGNYPACGGIGVHKGTPYIAALRWAAALKDRPTGICGDWYKGSVLEF